MDTSHLARLPAELRNAIYAYILRYDDGPIELLPGHVGRVQTQSHVRHDKLLALTRTCREIRQDTRLMFFALNEFLFIGDPPFLEMVFERFISVIGKQGADSLRRLTFTTRFRHLRLKDPGTEIGLGSLCTLRRFALQHPSCSMRLGLPLPSEGEPMQLDLRDLSWTEPIDRLATHASSILSEAKNNWEAAIVLEFWRSELGELEE